MNMFEDFIGYQGSAVLDEPVQEENSGVAGSKWSGGRKSPSV